MDILDAAEAFQRGDHEGALHLLAAWTLQVLRDATDQLSNLRDHNRQLAGALDTTERLLALS